MTTKQFANMIKKWQKESGAITTTLESKEVQKYCPNVAVWRTLERLKKHGIEYSDHRGMYRFYQKDKPNPVVEVKAPKPQSGKGNYDVVATTITTLVNKYGHYSITNLEMEELFPQNKDSSDIARNIMRHAKKQCPLLVKHCQKTFDYNGRQVYIHTFHKAIKIKASQEIKIPEYENTGTVRSMFGCIRYAAIALIVAGTVFVLFYLALH